MAPLSFPLVLFTTLVFANFAISQYTPLTSNGGACSALVKCPTSAPCCSEFGFCGTGQFCLGGCNPLWSAAPQACVPTPVCQNGAYTFKNNDRIVNASKYNGDPTMVDFTIDSGVALTTGGGELVLTLTQNGPTAAGTRISSTREVLYANMVARMRTSKFAGVVSTFITMSGVKDEIDWEFPGSRVNEGQTNWYYEGDTANYTHGGVANLSDSNANYHDYGINWTPTQIVWSVDGRVVRTLLKSSTLNNATGRYNYPNTPARVQLSIWPAGIAAQPLGTQQWAGGLIDWNTSDYRTVGYYYALVQSVTITCVPSSAAGISYTYGANTTDGGPSVTIGNNPTQIFAQTATGLNMDAGKTKTSTTNATFGLINGVSSLRSFSGVNEVIVSAGALIAGLIALV